MTPGPGSPPDARAGTAPGQPTPGSGYEPGRVSRAAVGLIDRMTALVGRLLGWGPVPTVMGVLDRYGAPGGGLLAAGLAFGALFALIPATLLVVGVAGFVVSDPAVREEVVRQLVALVPPLEPFVSVALDQLAAGAVAISIIGLLGFLWTASQFYGQLDHAFALILQSSRRRDMIERTIRGIVVVGLVIALFMLLLGASIASTETSLPGVGVVDLVAPVASPVIGYLAVAAVVAFMYRVVPTQSISWRAAWLPAAVVGLAESMLTGLFVLLAPYLASPKIFGPFFTIFATLAWLSWTFQILLYGAAWVGQRTLGPPDGPVVTDAGDGPPDDRP
jgi:membrane protein